MGCLTPRLGFCLHQEGFKAKAGPAAKSSLKDRCGLALLGLYRELVFCFLNESKVSNHLKIRLSSL